MQLPLEAWACSSSRCSPSPSRSGRQKSRRIVLAIHARALRALEGLTAEESFTCSSFYPYDSIGLLVAASLLPAPELLSGTCIHEKRRLFEGSAADFAQPASWLGCTVLPRVSSTSISSSAPHTLSPPIAGFFFLLLQQGDST